MRNLRCGKWCKVVVLWFDRRTATGIAQSLGRRPRRVAFDLGALQCVKRERDGSLVLRPRTVTASIFVQVQQGAVLLGPLKQLRDRDEHIGALFTLIPMRILPGLISPVQQRRMRGRITRRGHRQSGRAVAYG